jgi:hypothetical protein
VVPQSTPTPVPPAAQPTRAPDALDQLRALVGDAGPGADALVQVVRRELRREYERGYAEARGGRPAPARPNETKFQRWKRRLERRARHASREWAASTRQLRKMIFNVTLAVVMTAAGIVLSLHLANSNSSKKIAVPTATR